MIPLLVKRSIRWSVAATVFGAAALFAAGLPAFYAELRDRCVDRPCGAFYNPPPTSAWLAEQGLTASQYALSYAALYAAFAAVFFAAALAVFLKKPDDPLSQLGTLMLALIGVAFPPVLQAIRDAHPVVDALVRIVSFLGFGSFLTFFFLFPNGRFSSRWSRLALYALLAIVLPHSLFPGTAVDVQTWVPYWSALWMVAIVAEQAYRYRRLGVVERQQAKWAIYGVSLAVLGLIFFTAVYLANEAAYTADPYKMLLLELEIHGSMLLVPVTLGIAVLRRRLWDIDPLVNRTILYGLLTTLSVALYAASVWYVGVAFRTSEWWTSLIAASVVAVSFAPLRERMRRRINRWMYGHEGDPNTTLASLARAFERPLTPEAALRAVAAAARGALRLPYAAISVDLDGASTVVAEDGEPTSETRQEPLVYRGETLGRLHAAPRAPGEPFTASDLKLLALLARQAAVVAENVRVHLDLKRTVEALQESRERLVLAREEERKRLRRDLHDELAPRLAAIALTASAAEELLERDPAAARSIVSELRGVIRGAVRDIRDMVHNMRPPSLDELGLVGAIRERMREMGPPVSALEWRLIAPDALPPLPAAVEAAAYRIATEAMANALRHANARRCAVALSVEDVRQAGAPASAASERERKAAGLRLEVIDDGEGRRSHSDVPPTVASGIGLASMRERAEELGGTFRVEDLEEGGTAIRAWLPIHCGEEEEFR